MATCPACGNSIGPSVNYCPQCGTPLGAPPHTEEFKVVTIVFCDVVGSTAVARRLDPMSMQRVMDRYGETVRGVLAGRGGSVGKRHGDGFMAAFGIPELHEDDALRAVRAADELRAALGDLVGELLREWGVDLRVRLGIYTGNVRARRLGDRAPSSELSPRHPRNQPRMLMQPGPRCESSTTVHTWTGREREVKRSPGGVSAAHTTGRRLPNNKRPGQTVDHLCRDPSP
jgi:hypothetical protein